MSEKNETTFYKSLHKKLSKDVYYEKMSNPFRSGTPDFYFEGPTGKVLWVEYKWIEKEWDTDRPTSMICGHRGWVQQRRWLERSHKRGIDAYTILGIGKGRYTKAYILCYPYTFTKIVNIALSLDKVAHFLNEKLECNLPTQSL